MSNILLEPTLLIEYYRGDPSAMVRGHLMAATAAEGGKLVRTGNI